MYLSSKCSTPDLKKSHLKNLHARLKIVGFVNIPWKSFVAEVIKHKLGDSIDGRD